MGSEENIGMSDARVFASAWGRDGTEQRETTNDLLRELIAEVRGLRREMELREWRSGERLIGGAVELRGGR